MIIAITISLRATIIIITKLIISSSRWSSWSWSGSEQPAASACPKSRVRTRPPSSQGYTQAIWKWVWRLNMTIIFIVIIIIILHSIFWSPSSQGYRPYESQYDNCGIFNIKFHHYHRNHRHYKHSTLGSFVHFGNVLIVLTRIASIENLSPLSGWSSQGQKKRTKERSSSWATNYSTSCVENARREIDRSLHQELLETEI